MWAGLVPQDVLRTGRSPKQEDPSPCPVQGCASPRPELAAPSLPASAAVPASLQKRGCCLKRDAVPTQRPPPPWPLPSDTSRPQSCPPRLVKLDHHTPSHALPSVKGSSRQKLDQRTSTEQVHEGKDNGYLFSKKIASGAFSKVYLADATHECIHHNPKLSSDLQGKRHTMIAVKIVSTAEAPVEFSRKLLPREISSLNTTYKHLNVVQLCETYQSSQLVLELVAQGNLLEHINAALDPLYHPGLKEKEVLGLFWQLVSAMAHYHSVGIAYQRGRHLGRSSAHRHREAHLNPSQPYLLPPLSHAGT
ncbi:LOW QUALITY PROTEIN: testis-specific serine/threonine-protein kinase 5-like [Trachypithecus francoisi]|uniref:LOW QUALITY PROTEIN: testis-specific serine/threonine-protein kinase 5-like n=1 Tax=Trachypithecus francoisi TaxID=54180 RepID=UPI00141BCDF4|nr:LOW QUALITY PROTEIN: testis-specific serine/threonine-protein kinase 5-like [Trachypithecus francoisi]